MLNGSTGRLLSSRRLQRPVPEIQTNTRVYRSFWLGIIVIHDVCICARQGFRGIEDKQKKAPTNLNPLVLLVQRDKYTHGAVARLVSYTLVRVCHPSSHISSPTEIYLDSTIQIPFSSLQSASNTKASRWQHIYSVCTMLKLGGFFFLFTRTEYDWKHNCSINSLN